MFSFEGIELITWVELLSENRKKNIIKEVKKPSNVTLTIKLDLFTYLSSQTLLRLQSADIRLFKDRGLILHQKTRDL